MLAAAFFDDPVWSWLLPDDARRRTQLERFFAIETRIVAAHGKVWANGDGSAVALWLAPGEWRLPPREQVRHGRAFLRAFGGRLPRATALLAAMERRHVREPHHYLAYVGVAPSMQGRGLGTELLRPMLERCDAEGLPAYLEASSPRNAALYERLGFEARDELRFMGSPPLRLMLRPPA